MSPHLFLCSVGTSLLESYGSARLSIRREGRIDEFDNPLYERDQQSVAEWLARQEAIGPRRDVDTLESIRQRMLVRLLNHRWRHGDWLHVGDLRPQHRQWSRAVGAELATLAPFAPSAQAGDQVRFLCSDTAASVFCATHLAAACQSWGWSVDVEGGEDIEIISDLNPELAFADAEQRIKVALEGSLREIVRKLVAGISPGSLVVIGSGGFKSAVGALHQAVRELDQPADRCLAFLHEDSDRVINYNFTTRATQPDGDHVMSGAVRDEVFVL